MQSQEIAASAAKIHALCEAAQAARYDKANCLALRAALVALTLAPRPVARPVIIGLFNKMLIHCDSVDHRIGQHHASATDETEAFLELAIGDLKRSALSVQAAVVRGSSW